MALLVERLSFASLCKSVQKVNRNFVQMLGLNRRLTQARSNGVSHMLKLMPRTTSQIYVNAEVVKSVAGVGSVAENGMEVRASLSQIRSSSSGGAPEQRSMKLSIEKKLREALAPTLLVVDDVSHQHAGHAGVEKGATETHFNVKVVSEKFMGSNLVKRHRLIYSLLDEELKNGVHALSLVTKTPSEPVS